MRRSKAFQALLALFVLLALPGVRLSLAKGQADEPDYTVEWWTVDSGGTVGQYAMLPYSLGGTAGQPDAALWQGGDYTLQGGFWHNMGLVAEHYIYLPLVLRQS